MGKIELTPEILHQVAQCETVEGIIIKAKEYGEEITVEQAQRVFELSHPQSGLVSDEELDSVADGLPIRAPIIAKYCPYCQAVCAGQLDLEKHISERHPEK